MSYFNEVYPSIFFAVLLSLVGVIGDYFIKVSGQKSSVDIRYFILGFVIYASTAFGWFFVMRHVKLTTLGVIYTVSTVLFLTLLSVFYFKEKISVMEIFGIIMAIISMLILARFA